MTPERLRLVVLDDREHRWAEAPATQRLRARFAVTIHDRELRGDALIAAVRDAQALALNRERTPLDAALLAAMPHLRVVANTGAGLPHIDRGAVAARGIPILTTPTGSSASVVEQTFALILAVHKQLPALDAALRAGRWERPIVAESSARTLGVAGTGEIGTKVVRVAQAFGMPVIAWSRSLDDAGAARLGVERAASLAALAARVDVLSLHLRLVAETRGIVDAAAIDALRPGALLVNTARAGLIDRVALLQRLARGDLTVALDVFDEEPIPPRDPILGAPGVLSPHLGWMTDGTWTRFIEEAVDALLGWAEADG